MQTKVSVSFRIPKTAYTLLELMRKQNNFLKFELDADNREITLSCDILDFSEVSDDWCYEDIENFIEEVE